MKRLIVGGLALAFLVPHAVAEPVAPPLKPRSLPMHFQWQEEGPAEACGSHCRTWISAVGTITADTASEFSDFAKEHDVRGATLVLDTGGGSVHGAMELGREIRRYGITTTIGKTIPLAVPGRHDARAKISGAADCESMCAFVLLGGVHRNVPPQGRVLVHQIWLGDRRDDATAASYSAEDLVLVQRDIGRLAQYTMEMGGNIELLEIALRIPPWEPMRQLSRAELQRMGLDDGKAEERAPRAPEALTVSASPVTNGGVGSAHGGRGWIVVGWPERPVLTRHHPLTVEGDEIGSFELTFSCGETPGTFSVSYAEHRLGPDGASSPLPLKTVALTVGGMSQTLEVASSVRSQSQELSSLARGKVSAAFLQSFADLTHRSLMVSTASVNDARTAIRVGNTGMVGGFPRLGESCAKAPRHEARAQVGTLVAH